MFLENHVFYRYLLVLLEDLLYLQVFDVLAKNNILKVDAVLGVIPYMCKSVCCFWKTIYVYRNLQVSWKTIWLQVPTVLGETIYVYRYLLFLGKTSYCYRHLLFRENQMVLAGMCCFVGEAWLGCWSRAGRFAE